MKQATDATDRRRASLRSTPTARTVGTRRSGKRAMPKVGRIIEFATGVHRSRGGF